MTPKAISRKAAKAAGCAAVISGVIGGGQIFIAADANASTTNDTVMVTTQRMSSNTLNSAQVGTYGAGSHLNLICYTRGQSVKGYYSNYIPGGWDNIWYVTGDGYWVADVDINTNSNDPVTPGCATGTVMATTQRMAGATLNTSQAGNFNAGRLLGLSCYARGQSVKGYYSKYIPGGWDNLWYQTVDGYWVADVDINTGSNNPVTGACTNTPPPANNAVAAFVSRNMGKTLANQQGTYAGECVSLVSQYLGQVYGIRTSAWGNAVDYRSGGSGGAHLAANGFRWSTDQSFQNGDIIVWGQGAYTSGVGHIAVWYNGKIFDQNFAGRRSAGLDSFFISGYLGHWRK